MSSKAAKHARSPLGVVGLTGAPLCSLSLVSSELSVRHLSPPALPSRSSQSNRRDERKAHFRRRSVSGAPVKHEPLSRENSGKFWAASLESTNPEQDPCPLTVFTACVPGDLRGESSFPPVPASATSVVLVTGSLFFIEHDTVLGPSRCSPAV